VEAGAASPRDFARAHGMPYAQNHPMFRPTVHAPARKRDERIEGAQRCACGR